MGSKRLEEYLALLKIRQKAGRRDLSILGGIFIVSFIATVAFGLLDQLTGRSIYLVGSLLVVFGFACITAWVRLEIVKSSIELINNIQAGE